MSDDPEQEYFSDGITESIITTLARIPGFFVIAPNSTFTYKGKAVKVDEVARDLGVRYVLKGSVQRAGASLRITTQLIDAQTGSHVWAERYDRAAEDTRVATRPSRRWLRASPTVPAVATCYTVLVVTNSSCYWHIPLPKAQNGSRRVYAVILKPC